MVGERSQIDALVLEGQNEELRVGLQVGKVGVDPLKKLPLRLIQVGLYPIAELPPDAQCEGWHLYRSRRNRPFIPAVGQTPTANKNETQRMKEQVREPPMDPIRKLKSGRGWQSNRTSRPPNINNEKLI